MCPNMDQQYDTSSDNAGHAATREAGRPGLRRDRKAIEARTRLDKLGPDSMVDGRCVRFAVPLRREQDLTGGR